MFENLSEKLQEIIKKTSGNSTLTQENTDEALREIRRALLASDVSLIVVKSFISKIKDEIEGREVLKQVNPSQMLVKIVNDALCELLGSEKKPLKLDTNPSIIMLLGLQGSGKTTSCAKLALKLKEEGKSPIILACDVYRPAAINQLETLCLNNNIDFFKIDDCKDVLKIVDEGINFAKQNNNTVVIIDTAGRLQIDTDMMSELMLIERSHQINEKLLVIDSMTGQEAVDVAKNFDEQLGLTGIILTKLDGDTRGGCALSVVYTTKRPVKYIGMGEKIEPLEEFYPDRMANRILGMGDIVSLVEKAQKNINEEETKKLEEKMLKAEFSFDDFLTIRKQISALGSFGGILKMLPIPGLKNNDIDIISHEGEKHFKKIEVMISSMTPQERKNPDLLNASRKRRIAFGAGVSLEEFNAFINQFNQMKKVMKEFGSMKKSGLMSMLGRGSKFPF